MADFRKTDFSSIHDKELMKFCTVQFSEDGPEYTYYCGDIQVSAGDTVWVPVWDDQIKKGTVKNIIVCQKCEAPFPLEKIKSIIGEDFSIAKPSMTKEDFENDEEISEDPTEEDDEFDDEENEDEEDEYDEFDENDSDDWHPGGGGIGIDSLDELFDFDGDGKLDDFESAFEYDVIFDDDE